MLVDELIWFSQFLLQLFLLYACGSQRRLSPPSKIREWESLECGAHCPLASICTFLQEWIFQQHLVKIRELKREMSRNLMRFINPLRNNCASEGGGVEFGAQAIYYHTQELEKNSTAWDQIRQCWAKPMLKKYSMLCYGLRKHSKRQKKNPF